MFVRIVLFALALAMSGCGRQADAPQPGQNGPRLDAPGPESEPSRVFAPSNDAARAATGALTVSVAQRLPDAGQAGADAQEVLTLRAANGLVVEAQISGAVSPATIVQGQTLRALLALAVEEPQTLVYRVASETRAAGVGGLCGEAPAAVVVVWEPSGPGEAAMKLMGLTGGAPGAADARPCPMLEYRRS